MPWGLLVDLGGTLRSGEFWGWFFLVVRGGGSRGPTREGAWGPSVCLWVTCGALGVGSGNPWVAFGGPGGPLWGGGLGALGSG